MSLTSSNSLQNAERPKIEAYDNPYDQITKNQESPLLSMAHTMKQRAKIMKIFVHNQKNFKPVQKRRETDKLKQQLKILIQGEGQ
jgi:hypothetical protein